MFRLLKTYQLHLQTKINEVANAAMTKKNPVAYQEVLKFFSRKTEKYAEVCSDIYYIYLEVLRERSSRGWCPLLRPIP